MRKEKFHIDHIYHVYNRGVDKRKIFLDNSDYHRFLDFARVYRYKDLRLRALNRKNLARLSFAKLEEMAEPLVEILAYILMKNHFHFIVRQLKEDGITKFMHKLCTLYTMCFNEKYKRKGCLLEGPFKAISVTSDDYLFYLSFYIHSHPVEFISPRWKEGRFKNKKEAIQKMEEYKWSSYSVYLGRRDELVNRKFLLDCFKKGNSDGIEEYKNFVEDGLIEGYKRLAEIQDILLD